MQQTEPSSAQGGRFAFGALLGANLLLGFGPWMVRLADVGPVAAGFWRMALAAPLLIGLALIVSRGAIRPRSGLVLLILVAGLFFAADLAAWHTGIIRTKLANATLFGNAASLLLPAYGFLVLAQRPTRYQGIALALAVGGALLLLGLSYDASPEHLAGDLFALTAGACYTFYLIVVDRVRRDVAPLPLLAISTLASILPLLLFAWFLGETIVPHNWTPLLILSLGSQVLGQGLLVYSIGYTSPLVVGLALLTQPVVTAIIGWIVYDERLVAAEGFGALLICAAMVLIRLPAGRRTLS